jgi:Zn-dependent M28 family amino/carboxypeptidase
MSSNILDLVSQVDRDRLRGIVSRLASTGERNSPEAHAVARDYIREMFRSDHSPFWAAGIPAVLITDTANFRNPNYHAPTDTPNTLDYDFLRRVTVALTAAVVGHSSGERVDDSSVTGLS